MSVQISYKKQVLVGFILLLILLVAIEISLRVYDHYYPTCNLLKSEVYEKINFELKRDICNSNDRLIKNMDPLYILPNQQLQTININSEGFRGGELQDNPDYRIFFVGGSTAFGVGSTSDNTTISGYLQKIFSNSYPRYNIEVVNAGIPNAYSFTEQNLIKAKLLSYDPDLLIIYDGYNDVERDYDYFFESVDYKSFDSIIRLMMKSSYETPIVIWKLYNMHKYDTTDVIKFNPDNIDDKVLAWKNIWLDVCSMQNEYGFKAVITLQSLVGSGNKSLTLEEKYHYKHHDQEKKLQYYELYGYALSELNGICSGTIDLRNVFDSHSETIYYDQGHVGDNGNKIIAERMYNDILPLIINDLK